MSSNYNYINMEYQVGSFYNFTFKESYIGNDGNTLLRLTDPNNPDSRISVKPYDFQIDWDNNIFREVRCYCKSQNIYGNYKFELSRDVMLDYLYGSELYHYKEFVIKKRIDADNGKICCYISDTYGYSQRYFPKDKEFWEKHQVEDDIILYVKGIRKSTDGKNDAFLMLEAHEDVDHQNSSNQDTQQIPFIRNEKIESIGVEDDYTEFKSSIAFPAGGTEEDMPKQLTVITQSIAGFMNKDGGSLYIGVNDSGEAFKDVSEEFQYLNDDDDDTYNYKPNADHYKLKLHNKIRTDLGDYASSLVNIVFQEANGVKYAVIKVKKANSVVWHRETKLFVRCDNCTRRMKGDSITKFILTRVKPNDFEEIVNRPAKEKETNNEIIETAVPQTIVKSVTSGKEEKTSEEKAWRYISFFKNGQWSFRKNSYPKEEELLAEVSIPNNPKSYVLMIAYMSGKINAVALKDLLYGTGAKKNTLIACDTLRNNGISSTDDQVVSIFCMKKGGIVLMESVVNGETFVKAHNMDVVTTHQSPNAQGNKMLPEGKLIRIASIEAGSVEMDSIIAMGLLVKDYERYNKNGVIKSNLQGKYQVLLDNLLNNSGYNLKGECAKIDVSSLEEPKDEISSGLIDIQPEKEATSPKSKEEFSADDSSIIEAVIKDRIFKFTLNGVVRYERFESKKLPNTNHDVFFAKMGRDILIFLSKKKAAELNTEHSPYIRLRGNGEDPRFSQDFGSINGDIKNQRENNSRIFVFEHHDDETCLFYDELQYVSYDMEQEDGRRIIMFKMKSLHRFKFALDGLGNYFAIEVPLDREANWFIQLKDRLKNVPVNWQKDVYHILLSYIQGDPDYASSYVVMIQHQLEHYHAQSLTFDHLAVFKTKKGELVICLKASQPDENFKKLVNMVRNQVRQFPVLQSEFRLHVTLGRIEAGKFSLEEVQRLVCQVQIPAFKLRLSRVYHRLGGSKEDHKSWDLE